MATRIFFALSSIIKKRKKSSYEGTLKILSGCEPTASSYEAKPNENDLTGVILPYTEEIPDLNLISKGEVLRFSTSVIFPQQKFSEDIL